MNKKLYNRDYRVPVTTFIIPLCILLISLFRYRSRFISIILLILLRIYAFLFSIDNVYKEKCQIKSTQNEIFLSKYNNSQQSRAIVVFVSCRGRFDVDELFVIVDCYNRSFAEILVNNSAYCCHFGLFSVIYNFRFYSFTFMSSASLLILTSYVEFSSQ